MGQSLFSAEMDLVHDVPDLIQDMAVPVHDDTDDAVSERKRIRLTDDAAGLGRQIMDIHYFQSGFLQTDGDFRTGRIDGDTILGHHDIDTLSRRDEGRHFRDDTWDTSP